MVAALIDEEKSVVIVNQVLGADAAVKIVEIGAATEGNVLAIIDEGAVRKRVRGGASSKERALFVKSYPKT